MTELTIEDVFAGLIENSLEYEIHNKTGVEDTNSDLLDIFKFHFQETIRSNFQDNLEEIRGLEVNLENCKKVLNLLLPLGESELQVGQGLNFVGELYFLIFHRGDPLFELPVE